MNGLGCEPSTVDYAAKSLSGLGLKATVWKLVSYTGSKNKKEIVTFSLTILCFFLTIYI